MSWIPEFELGIWNAWIFIILAVLPNILGRFIFKGKNISVKPKTSLPRKYKKIFNIIMAPIVIGIIYSIFLPLHLNTLWFYIGLLIFLFGFGLQLTVLYTLQNAKPDRAWTTGPYRYSRQPIYLGMYLMIFSISIMTLSWLFLLLAILLAIPLLIASSAEERYCLETYGKEYQEYMRRTPRWIGLPKSKK